MFLGLLQVGFGSLIKNYKQYTNFYFYFSEKKEDFSLRHLSRRDTEAPGAHQMTVLQHTNQIQIISVINLAYKSQLL